MGEDINYARKAMKDLDTGDIKRIACLVPGPYTSSRRKFSGSRRNSPALIADSSASGVQNVSAGFSENHLSPNAFPAHLSRSTDFQGTSREMQRKSLCMSSEGQELLHKIQMPAKDVRAKQITFVKKNHHGRSQQSGSEQNAKSMFKERRKDL